MTNKILSFAIFFLIVFKVVAIYFTEFSLYGDEAQYWLWSQTLDLGYYSKPPLLAWFLGGYSFLFGDSFVSLKIFPIVIYFFISYAIYKLCLNLSFDNKNAKLCALSFELSLRLRPPGHGRPFPILDEVVLHHGRLQV